jgi:hypothetical protein
MPDPTFFERRGDAAFQHFLCTLFTPAIDGVGEVCAEFHRRAEYARHCARISAGAKRAWARRRRAP